MLMFFSLLQLVESRKKMVEFQEDMDFVNRWIDGAEKEMSKYKDDMSAKEKQNLHDKIKVKLCRREKIKLQSVTKVLGHSHSFSNFSTVSVERQAPSPRSMLKWPELVFPNTRNIVQRGGGEKNGFAPFSTLSQ